MKIKKIIKHQWECILRYVYIKCWDIPNKNEKIFLFESRDGFSFTDSPRYVFNELMKRPSLENSKFVWIYSRHVVLDDLKTTLPFVDERVMFVKRDTISYAKILAKANYLITNSTFPFWFVKSAHQIYLNTWHGTPLKKMGFDLPDSELSKNVIRNFLMADVILSPNDHMTNILKNSYKLDGIYTGVIAEVGLPIMDTIGTAKDILRRQFSAHDIEFDELKQTILYAPTFRGMGPNQMDDSVNHLLNDVQKMQYFFEHRYNFLVKVHPYVYRKLKKILPATHLIPDYVDTNDVLQITDILITDYSSVFFDFLNFKKPILFYVWDQKDYDSERGMYFTKDDLPGPVFTKLQLLQKYIGDGDFQLNRSLLMKSMTVNDDGNASRRAVNILLGEKKITATSKKNILIVAGKHRLTGEEIKTISLLSYEFDVTLLLSTNNTLNAELKKVRKMYIFGHILMTPFEKIMRSKDGVEREYKRLVGMIDWDKIIVLDEKIKKSKFCS